MSIRERSQGSGGGPWLVEHHRGSATEFHGRPLPHPPRRAVWWFEVDRPALVLGSTQPEHVVDRRAAAAAGVEVVRRRSGGGAVWLAPGAVTWVDVVVPSSDPLWEPDVTRSSRWLGETWVRALTSLGVAGSEVHRGPMVDSEWSKLVCFAGLAPGEVTVAGRKVVGVSQRRTRAAARFQCAVLHRWDPAELLDHLDLGDPERAKALEDLGPVAAGVGTVTGAAVARAFEAALPG